MNIRNKKVNSRKTRGASSRWSLGTRASRPTTRNSPRRGILLLVALSLLVLFLLVGTAFVVTARHSSRTAKTVGKANQIRSAEAGQADLLDNVLKQIVRDTNNPNSSLRFHSLLRDMYGNDGFTGVLPILDPNEPNPPNNPTNWEYVDETGGEVNPPAIDTGDNLIARWAPTRDNAGVPQNLNVTNGQILEVDIVRVTDMFGNEALAVNPQGMKQLRNAYNGMSFTFTSGPAEGVTTRIVGYIPADTSGAYQRAFARFRLLSFRLADGSTLPTTSAEITRLFSGSRFVVNGRPFNGTGVGYDPFAASGDARLSTQENGQPLALLPNTVYFDPGAVTVTGGNDPRFYFPNNVVNQNSPYFGIGGSDESYDAVDFQNMILGLMPQNAIEIGDPGAQSLTIVDPGPDLMLGTEDDIEQHVPLPSLHRPALLNFHNGGTAGSNLHFNPMLLRKVSLRPSWFDHPNFTGSNPDLSASASTFGNAFQEVIVDNGGDLSNLQSHADAPGATQALLQHSIYGPWDVDNDNDGVRDSVWVDFGAPVMSMPDGTLVKPLAAILCLDMDGRLNVNAHASSEMIDPWPYSEPVAGGQMSNMLPSGSGMGPAEISLLPLFQVGGSGLTPQQTLNKLLGGSDGGAESTFATALPYTGRPLHGRYGYDQPIGSFARKDRAGRDNMFDIEMQLSLQGVPQGSGNWKSAYGSIPDFKGRYATGLNDFGQPITEVVSDSTYSAADTPYELNLFQITSDTPNTADTPFTLAELERILRAYDVDAAAAPDRLANLGEFLDPARLQQTRNLVTTDSWDLPVPSWNLPSWVNETDGTKMDLDGNTGDNDSFQEVMGRPAVGAGFADLIEYRFRAANGITAGTALTVVQRRATEMLVPHDLANGTKLDINRALGNGRDDNGNGVVDEPGEWNDLNTNGEIDPGEVTYWAFTGPAAAPANRPAASEAFLNTDRVYVKDDGTDSAISPEERGDTDNSGRIEPRELLELDNQQRQALARDLYITALATADPFPLLKPSGEPTDEAREKCRQLAQWAINAVDFRDADSAMTAFEYDINPFDGWDVDGDIRTVGGTSGLLDSLGTDGIAGTADDIGGIVWGMERPELVMTETLAWHDRRTSNYSNEIIYSDRDNLNPNEKPRNPSLLDRTDPDKDQDFDQRLVPRGGLLVEIYNPNTPNPAAPADTHLIAGGQDRGVNLSQFTTYSGTERSPVWRMAFYKRTDSYSSEQALQWNPDALVAWKAATGATPAVVGRPPMNIKLDRSAYFTDFAPNYDPNVEGEPFYSGTARPYHVRPGRYMVVGGDNEVVIADQNGSRSDPGKKSRRFELNSANGSVRLMHENDGTVEDPFTGEEMRTPQDSGFADASPIAAAIPGSDIAIINRPNPLTASEPAEGYPERIMGARLNNATGEYEDGNGTLMTLDVPLDGPIGITRPADQIHPDYPEFEAAKQTVDAIYSSQPDPRVTYSIIFLQRLANPSLGWNPEVGHPEHRPNEPVNPYRTVDSMGVNLSVFNSIGDVASGKEGDEEDGTSPREARRTFTSVQRGMTGQEKLRTAPNPPPNLPMASMMAFEPFSSEKRPTLGPNSGADGLGINPPAPANFRQMLARPELNGDFNFDAIPSSTIGYLNRPFQDGDPALTGEAKHAKPQTPFEWVAWNDRPYISGKELMLVPKTSSFNLLRSFATADGDNPATTSDPFDPLLAPKWPYQAIRDGNITPEHNGFEHLLGFHNAPDPMASMPPNPNDPMTGLSRLLDFVHTPSLFVGTKTWLNPLAFSEAATPVVSVDDPRFGTLVPFNSVFNFRDPGKVNINTITNEAVWDGIQHDIAGGPSQKHLGPDWTGGSSTSLVATRRGYAGTNLLSLDGDYPTFFANPLRGHANGDLSPLDNMKRPDVETGFLRSDEIDATTAPSDTPMFFEQKEARGTALTDKDPRNTDRNASFFYQPVTRLDNLTTTQSNVYSIWTTVGFFEATTAPTLEQFADVNGLDETLPATQTLYDRVYPEGYQFGREYGLDTGDTRRLRGFSIVDRSIPAGFEPGHDHNTRNVIRLTRQIE